MSHAANQIVSVWKDIESLIRCITPMRMGKRICASDRKLHQDTVLLTTLAWYDLITSGGCSFNDYRRWVTLVSQWDIIKWCETFKVCDDTLLAFVREGTLPTYATFKQSLSHIPDSGAFMGPLRGVFAQLVCQPEDAFSILHCAFAFPSRVNYSDVDDLREAALTSYLEKEDLLATVQPSTEEALLIKKWFPRTLKGLDRFYSAFEPHHGHGAVAEHTRSLREKYLLLGTDARLRYLDNKLGDRTATPRIRGSFDRSSRVKFVAKTAVKLRTICMEPATLMWYQEGFLDSIVMLLKHHSYLRKRIDTSDQQWNRDLAWEGSLDGSIATIDLSAASDSVSWKLVKAWFRDSVMREALSCTRSTRTQLPDGSFIDTQKFAPMGSALCFPIECIVFCAITEAAIIEAGGNPMTSRYRIYGDDIIVESCYVDTLRRRLSQNGFTLNVQKSFWNTGSCVFRESCGGEYLNMADVTPVRLPRKFSGLRIERDDPESILELIELANDTYVRLPSVRRRIIALLIQMPIRLRPRFGSSGSDGLFSPQATNFHLGSLDRIDWQRSALVCGMLKPFPANLEMDSEDIRLFEYLRCARGRKRLTYPEDRLDVSIDPPDRLQWVSHTY